MKFHAQPVSARFGPQYHVKIHCETNGAIMNQAKYEAAKKLNDLETRLKIIDETVVKTEDMLISVRQVQAMTRGQLKLLRAEVAAMPDDAA